MLVEKQVSVRVSLDRADHNLHARRFCTVFAAARGRTWREVPLSWCHFDTGTIPAKPQLEDLKT